MRPFVNNTTLLAEKIAQDRLNFPPRRRTNSGALSEAFQRVICKAYAALKLTIDKHPV